jgi:hypothetical protein
MTSPAKRRANQRNAAKSTGPRTPAGKKTVARNAFRHGFSLPLPVDNDPTLAGEVLALGRRIALSVRSAHLRIADDVPVDPACLERACRVAEAQIDLIRVRTAKVPLTTAMGADLTNCSGPIKQLLRLDRYEGRVLSRRKRAIREFDAAFLAWAQGRFGKTKPTEKAK